MERRRPAGGFAPSWVDRLTDRVDRLPGPGWLPYTIVFGVLALAANGAGWLDGTVPTGSFDPYLTSLALYPVTAIAAIHHLDEVAGTALERLRPALAVGDDEFRLLRYRLTTLPAGATIVASFIGLAFALGYVVLGLDSSLRLRGPTVLAFDVAIAMVGFPLLAVFFFHTIRQLRLITRIQARIATIDVFRLEPLLAFSRLSARSGLIILGLGYVSAATEPSTFTLANPTLLAFVVIAILIATTAFVLPMYGLHQRIAIEKERLAADASADLKRILEEVSRRAGTGDLTDADALNKLLSSLVVQRDVIARIPTWPWQPATLRGFATAVLLPIAIWLALRALDRLLA